MKQPIEMLNSKSWLYRMKLTDNQRLMVALAGMVLLFVLAALVDRLSPVVSGVCQ